MQNNMTEEQKDRTAAGVISIEKVGLTGGVITCASLIIYFIMMRYLNVMDSPFAWGMNFIILLTGIILTYQYYRSKTKLNVNYFPGLILGGILTAVSVIPYVLFVYIWFSQADAGQILLLKDNVFFMGEQVTPARAAAATMVEGVCSGAIISFTLMQYYKSGFKRASKEIIVQG